MRVTIGKQPPFLGLAWTIPPCTHVVRTRLDLNAGVIEYVGQDNRRLAGTIGTVAGGVITAAGLGLLRSAPGPWKLVSLAFAGAGAAFGVLAHGYGRTENSFSVRRGEGIIARCQSPGAAPLEYAVAAPEIEELEVVKQIVEHTDEHRTTRSVDWRLDVITRGGPLRLALFRTADDARELQRQISAVLER